MSRWPWQALAAGLAAAVTAAGVYLWMTVPAPARNAVRAAKPAAEISSHQPLINQARKATGGLHVESTPSGARVLVDGKARGVTPLTLTDLVVGPHAVELDGAQGQVRRTLTIAAGETATMNELIFAGWLAVYAPFDVSISEGKRPLRLDDRNQVMLPPGPHDIRLVNQALGYDAVHRIELKPGDLATLSVTAPRSALNVNATEPAVVWLDGSRVGETPLSDLPVDIGTHEIIVRRSAGGERRFTVTVTVKPFTLYVDFSKPQTHL